MKTKPLVSVILPAFNSGESIGEAIRSVLLQTLDDLELIVVDDASSDATAQAAEQAADGDLRVHTISLNTNTGPGGARNAGIELAQGEWISLLDADDAYQPQRLNELTQQAQTLKADLIADNLCIRSGQIQDPSNLAFPTRRMQQRQMISASAFIDSDRPHHGMRAAGFMKPLINRQFLSTHQIRYDERFRVGQDFELYVRSLLLGAKLYYNPGNYYIYELRLDSQCRGKDLRNSRQFLTANDHLLSLATRMGNQGAAHALNKRREALVNWLEYVKFVEKLRSEPFSSTSLLQDIPPLVYTAGRLSAAVLRRLSGSLKVAHGKDR